LCTTVHEEVILELAPLELGCPVEEDVAAFVGGRLEAARACALESHVADCASCRQLVSALAQTTLVAASADSVLPTLPLHEHCEFLAGERIGRYVVLGWLGAGGMGVVYAAYDPELNRKIALKLLRGERLARTVAEPGRPSPLRDRLVREAQAMAQLAHPNVVAVFDVGTVHDQVFIAMELVEGKTLRQWLRAADREPAEILAVFGAAGHGLAAAHAAGLIHRDFKPDNVLIGEDGRVRVTDFGLARRTSGPPRDAGCSGTAEHASAIQTGLAGTLAYMAPEQHAGHAVDARADQFSFAVALYEALYGERPFGSARTAGAPVRHRVDAAQRHGVPAAVRHAVRRALSSDPADRYPSMAALLAAVAPPPRGRRSLRLVIGAIATMAIAVATAAGYMAHVRRTAELRTELVGRLRGLAPALRAQLRHAHMLPLHDIRPEREQIRDKIRGVERDLQTPAGQHEIALIDLVLGEGHRALGDHDRALPLLEAAWAAGERGPEIDAALGSTLGAAYEAALDQIEMSVPGPRREAQVRALEQRYRDPAMAHLRAALAAGTGSPGYLSALIAFHQHRFDESSRLAHAAFAEAPAFYEAEMLEAKAHNEAARQLWATNRADAAMAQFATASQLFEHVLEMARSDDEAWFAYGDMLVVQLTSIAYRDVPADLQQRAIAALHEVRQINADHWKAIVREAQLHATLANLAILGSRDPGPEVDKVLALADEARAHGAPAEEIDTDVCVAHWERADHQSSRGADPRVEYQQAIAACERSASAKPEFSTFVSLGVVYLGLAVYDGKHGIEPTRFDLAERSLRQGLTIEDDAIAHYDLGQMLTRKAEYQESHGRNVEHAVETAIAEFQATLRLDATRSDAWLGMTDAWLALARFQQARHLDVEPTLTRARRCLERAAAVDANGVPVLGARIRLAQLEAATDAARGADPAGFAARIRAAADRMLQKSSDDGFAHRARCEAALLEAPWAIAHHGPVTQLLTLAASEAARARAVDPTDAMAWAASAEVDQMWLTSDAARGQILDPVVAARAKDFLDHALAIDPVLERARRGRDELARRMEHGAGAVR
jgi:tetratricopeptide (TPR) repeat protein